MKCEKIQIDAAFWTRLAKVAERKKIDWTFSNEHGIPDYCGDFTVGLVLTPNDLDEQFELERVYGIVRDEFGPSDDIVNWEVANAHIGSGYYPSSLVLLADNVDLERVAPRLMSSFGI